MVFFNQMGLLQEARSAIKQELKGGDYDTPDVTVLAGQLKAELMSQITSSDMPGGVKNALANSISVRIISDTHAVISISLYRPSIYMERAYIGKYSMVDLALIYDNRKRIKQSAVYYDKVGNFIPIGKIEGFARAYNNNYLQKTADSFMAKNPDCIVTVSK